jgi:tetratricopeptide (TPR) repeat protein
LSIARTFVLGLLLLIISADFSSAQAPPRSGQLPHKPGDSLEIPPKMRRPQFPPDHSSMVDLRRRLVELDRLLSLGSISSAESLLEDLEQHSALQRELMTRRIKLAQLKGDYQEAVRLCREALVGQDLNPGLWRSLAESQLAVDQPDSALESIGHFIATNPNSLSATMVGVDLLQSAGQQAMGVALIDSMRVILGRKRPTRCRSS